MMQFTRARYFMVGILLILLGIQFRMVESVTLSEQATRRDCQSHQTSARRVQLAHHDLVLDASLSQPKKRVAPPRWLGLALVAVGDVFSLHAMAMPRSHSGGNHKSLLTPMERIRSVEGSHSDNPITFDSVPLTASTLIAFRSEMVNRCLCSYRLCISGAVIRCIIPAGFVARSYVCFC